MTLELHLELARPNWSRGLWISLVESYLIWLLGSQSLAGYSFCFSLLWHSAIQNFHAYWIRQAMITRRTGISEFAWRVPIGQWFTCYTCCRSQLRYCLKGHWTAGDRPIPEKATDSGMLLCRITWPLKLDVSLHSLIKLTTCLTFKSIKQLAVDKTKWCEVLSYQQTIRRRQWEG